MNKYADLNNVQKAHLFNVIKIEKCVNYRSRLAPIACLNLGVH
jgi:hypothetical protein